MTADWISLPLGIYRKIGDYCKAKDVLAWASTCRTMKTQLNLSVLRPSYELIYSQHYSASPLQEAMSIPIFFPNHCHSVCVTCQWIDPGTAQESARIYIVSRPKSSSLTEDVPAPKQTTQDMRDAESSSTPTTTSSGGNNEDNSTTTNQRWIQDHQGNRATIVWEPEPRPPWIDIHELVMDATWNYDPTQVYFLWFSCPIYLLIEHFQIQALLVWEDDPTTRYRQATYSRCMAIEALEQEELFSSRVEPNDAFGCTPDYQAKVHSMVAELFSATMDTLTKTVQEPVVNHSWTATTESPTNLMTATTPPSPPTCCTILPTVFQSIASKHGMDNLHKLLKPLRIMANIYEQLVEQREPQYCSTFPLQSVHHPDENNSICHDNENHGRAPKRRLVVLPWLSLKTEFGWVPKEYLKEIPRFVARIPLAPNTQRIHLQAQRRGTQYAYRGHGSCTFFVFAQLRSDNTTGPTDHGSTLSPSSTSLSPDSQETAAATTTHTTTSSAYPGGTHLWKMGDAIYCRRHLFIMSETANELDISISVRDQDDDDVQAYYLYVVPDKNTMEEFTGLQVQLHILEFENDKDDDNVDNNKNDHTEQHDSDDFDYSLSEVMELFLSPLRAHESSMSVSLLEQGISFPLQLLKATALTLCTADGSTSLNNQNQNNPNLALVSFLEKNGLSTTPSGLACIVELIDAIAHQKKSSFDPTINAANRHPPDGPDDPMIRTFRVM